MTPAQRAVELTWPGNEVVLLVRPSAELQHIHVSSLQWNGFSVLFEVAGEAFF